MFLFWIAAILICYGKGYKKVGFLSGQPFQRRTNQYVGDQTCKKNEQQQQWEDLQQERAMNALEASLNEARRIRELSKSGQLSDEERRKRATDAAMLILQTMEQMGFQDDEDDDDEDLDDDNSLVVDDTLEEK